MRIALLGLLGAPMVALAAETQDQIAPQDQPVAQDPAVAQQSQQDSPPQEQAPASDAAQTAESGLTPMPPPLPLAPETPRAVSPSAPVAEGEVAQPAPTQPRGYRPRMNPALVPPAATKLAPNLTDLPAPASLGLPTNPEQVRILELRPLGLAEVENLVEVNNPNLKAIASQVDQAQSNLRAQIAQWYPNLNLQLESLPAYTTGQARTYGPSSKESADRWALGGALTAQWALINPQRNPSIAAARDQFEKAKYQYIVALRDLRLQAATAYFDLQQADDQVRIGQESVRASIVSLRDSKARFQAGVATKLEVLEAETQLSRDQQLLTNALAAQTIARRTLAALLDLPQNVSPTAKDPSRVIGVWQPSLQESIIAAYTFREELDQALLDISIANSQANASLGSVQPFLNVFAAFSGDVANNSRVQPDINRTNYDTAIGLNLTWNIFDGGAAAAQSRQNKQLAQENTFRFAQRRDGIRQEVETSFYELEKNNRNIVTTSREVVSARESLRLARLRFQAGVTTQREVVDNQRDLTNAEVRYSNAISDYNKRLAELRRRTGLDQVASCTPQALPGVKPVAESNVPVEPTPLIPACQAAAQGAV